MNQALPKEETEDAEAAMNPQGLGATLKALRRAKQLSLADVSTRLKYTARQLEALEAEKWEKLPSGVPLRGLVKNYGRLLETDIDSLMVMLENEVGVPDARPIVLTTASLSSSDMTQPEGESRSSWGWWVVILVLLIVAGFYAIERGWVPDSWLVFDWLRTLKQ